MRCINLFSLLFWAGLVLTGNLCSWAQVIADTECSVPTRLTEADRAKRRQLREQQLEALKTGGFVQAVEIQRQVVRLQCDNRYQLYYLAELLLQAGDVAGATEWLERLYDRKVNDMEERLASPRNPLFPLSRRPEFLESVLARKIETKRQEFEQRRARFLKQLDALPAQERPPADYVAEDVCPFECCTYGEWTVLEDTELVAAPQSTQAVGTAVKGSTVLGLTGEVHLRPIPVAVVLPKTNFRPDILIPAGKIIFLLDYMGEGYRHVWYEGAVLALPVVGEVQEHCPFPNGKCWGELLAPDDDDENYSWWVKVRLPYGADGASGTEGWTAEINFGNIDSCG